MQLKGGTYELRELLVPIFRDGQCIYEKPSTMAIRQYAGEEMAALWDEYKRLTNPAVVPVDLSDELYYLKEEMLHEYKKD